MPAKWRVKKLNYLAADGVVETQPGSSAQTSQTTGRPTAAPTRVYPTPPPVSNPDDKETIEAVDGPTPGPIISQTATPAPTPATLPPTTVTAGFAAQCKVIKVRSFRDTVGRGVNKADGSPDAQLRLKLGSGAGIITAIELRASGRLSGYWSTATTAKAWPLNVLRHGRPAGGAGLPLYLAIAPGRRKAGPAGPGQQRYCLGFDPDPVYHHQQRQAASGARNALTGPAGCHIRENHYLRKGFP